MTPAANDNQFAFVVNRVTYDLIARVSAGANTRKFDIENKKPVRVALLGLRRQRDQKLFAAWLYEDNTVGRLDPA